MKTTIKQMAERMNRIDTFSPYFFLPFILMLYFFVSLFDFHRFELFNVTVSIWPAVFVALASYYVTVYFVDKKGWTFPTFGLSFLRGYTMWAIYLLGLIGLVAYISMIAGGEVGITDESIRRNLDPKLNFLSQLLWFSTMLIISLKIIQDENMSKGKLLMYGALYGGLMFLYLLMGYRTPIIVMLFTGLIIFHYVVKEIKLTWFLTTLLIIGIFFSLFGFFRVISEDTSLDFNSREQPDVELTKEKEKELITV